MKKTELSKKILKFACVFVVLFLFFVFTSIATEHYIFPYLSAQKFFSRWDFLKKFRENVTIINKTEQITIQDDGSINKIASQAETSVVNIISIGSAKDKKTSAFSPAANKNGTGIIVTGDGLIVTYRAVILEQNAEYKIFTYDGSVFEGKLVGIDNLTNLAYLKINASNLPPIAFADSNDFFPGKKLIAIGNSFEEYQNRYAAGLLSNINKIFNINGGNIHSSEKLEGVFETDFAEQETYVGGPVIGYNGELAGIVGSVTIDNQKKYFEIPSNVVKKSIDLAIKNELESRPYLGVYYLSITKNYAAIHNFPLNRGAIIFSPSGKQGLAVISESPAEKAGLKINDVILKINGQEINLNNPLSTTLGQYKKGTTVKMSVWREGKEMEIEVAL